MLRNLGFFGTLFDAVPDISPTIRKALAPHALQQIPHGIIAGELDLANRTQFPWGSKLRDVLEVFELLFHAILDCFLMSIMREPADDYAFPTRRRDRESIVVLHRVWIGSRSVRTGGGRYIVTVLWGSQTIFMLGELSPDLLEIFIGFILEAGEFRAKACHLPCNSRTLTVDP